MVALVGLRNQFVDLAVGDLREDAVAFANRQQDGVEHGVDAAYDLRIGALELFRLAAVGELAFFRGVGQARHFLLQALHHDGDIVDRLLHLLVVAFIGLGDQLVDLAIEIWARMRLPSPIGSRMASSISLMPLHNLAIDAVKLVMPAAFAETAVAGGIDQAHDFLRDPDALLARLRLLLLPLSVAFPCHSRIGALRLSGFPVNNFSWHKFLLLFDFLIRAPLFAGPKSRQS